MLYFHKASNSEIFYQKYGQNGPVVILLHGLASSSKSWLWLAKALRAHYQVYLIDFPGHGQSPRWESYTFENFAELIKDWMDDCGISTAVFIGVSLGCSIALTLALRHPGRVRAIVLEGPFGGYLPVWKALGALDWLAFKLLPGLLLGSVFLLGHHATAQWLNTFGVKKKREYKALAAIQSMVDLKAIRQLLWQAATPPYVGKLQQIKVPVLLVRGGDDPMPKRYVQYIQENLPIASLVEVPGARHLVAMERPQQFNQLVLDFLTEIQESAAAPGSD